ncbi:unknown [Prevotella sp. CAG:255]|nr:unknown [Prevotella sp. CAG:255]
MLSDSISDRTLALLFRNKDRSLYHHKAFGFFTFNF